MRIFTSLCLTLFVGAAMAHGDEGLSSAAVDDRAKFAQMQQAFERAVNENRFDLLTPFLDPQFRGTSIAGTDLAGVEQLAAFMARARMLMGTGAKYHLKLHPTDTAIDGEKAKSSGTTEEEIILPDGQRLSYKSLWSIDLKKRDGKWLVTSADTKVDLRDKLTIAAHVVASRIWQAGLNLHRVRLGLPDFDQDNGFHNAVGVESDPAAPDKGAKKEAPQGLQKDAKKK